MNLHVLKKMSLMNSGVSTFLLSAMVLFADCSLPPQKPAPHAVKGVLDLRQWDFLSAGVLRLDGEWEFYRDTLLYPRNFANTRPPNCQIVRIPHKWNSVGKGTYRLQMHIKHTESILAITVILPTMAYRIWNNGMLIAEDGSVGSTAQESKPNYLQRVIPFYPHNDNLEIVIQTSSFHHKAGGLWPTISLAEFDKALALKNSAIITRSIIIGALLFLAMLQMAIFLYHRSDMKALWYSISFVLLACWLLVYYENLIRAAMPGLPLQPHFGLTYMCGYFAPITFILALANTYQEDFSAFTKILTTVLIGLGVIINALLAAMQQNSFLSMAYGIGQMLTYVIIALIFSITMVRILKRKRIGSVTTLAGMCLLLCTLAADAFAVGYSSISLSIPLIPFGALGLSACMTFIVAKTIVYQELGLHRQQIELAHSEKLATIGTLTASVAHEINNPNNALSLSLKSQKQAWDELEPILDRYAEEQGDFEVGGFTYEEFKREIRQSLKRASGNSERIKKIVEELRAFSRREEGSFEDVNINEVVHSSLNLVGNLMRKKTSNLQLELQENLPKIKGNHQRLEQVVINFLQNAAQALESPDKSIKISTSHDVNTDRIILAIKDEGKGIAPKDLEHIFDPFYTTKSKDEGTGLGLSICKRIIDAHNGNITIESEPGKGTRAFISLPCCPAVEIH